MKIKTTFSCVLVACGLSVQAFAQADSTAVVTATWQKKKLAKGVVWKSTHLTNHVLFQANEYINLIEFTPRSKKVLLTVGYSDSLENTSAIGTRQHALAAINGSFFKMRGLDPDHHKDLNGVPKQEPARLDHNRSIVYLRVSDSLIADQQFSNAGVRKRHQEGVVAIRERAVDILKADATNPTWEHTLFAHDVMASGPMLLQGGIHQPLPNDAFCNDRHPRTAVGRKADGTVVLFVVDGRAQESAGMSIGELQKVMRWVGCVDALNLDGGGSTTMYIDGQPYHGVVNHPSDNKKFDHEGERAVANVLLLIKVHPRR